LYFFQINKKNQIRDELNGKRILERKKVKENLKMGFSFMNIIGFGKCNPKVEVVERNR